MYVKRQGVQQERRQFWVSICQLIFKQQAGSVLVTDKGPRSVITQPHLQSLSPPVKTSSGILETATGERGERERGFRRTTGGGGRSVCVCVCVFLMHAWWCWCLHEADPPRLYVNVLFSGTHMACGTTPCPGARSLPSPLASPGMRTFTHVHTHSSGRSRKIKR